MDGEQAVRWVLVRSFNGLYQEIDADLLVTALRGHQIPVQRLPQQIPMTMLYRSAAAYGFPVQVCVPAEYLTEASELAAEQTLGTVPPALRTLMQWYLAVTVFVGLMGSWITARPEATAWQALSWVPFVLCEVWLVVAVWQFVTWIWQSRPRLVTWYPVGVAVLAWAAVTLVAWCLQGLQYLSTRGGVDNFWPLAASLALIVLVAGLLRSRHR